MPSIVFRSSDVKVNRASGVTSRRVIASDPFAASAGRSFAESGGPFFATVCVDDFEMRNDAGVKVARIRLLTTIINPDRWSMWAGMREGFAAAVLPDPP